MDIHDFEGIFVVKKPVSGGFCVETGNATTSSKNQGRHHEAPLPGLPKKLRPWPGQMEGTTWHTSHVSRVLWGVPQWGVPQNGWFIRESRTKIAKMDDSGVPLF